MAPCARSRGRTLASALLSGTLALGCASAGTDHRMFGGDGGLLESDAGSPADAGSGDAGAPTDAGASSDVGLGGVDAFVPRDAGVDAFVPRDAGVDAFVPRDAGVDAFTPRDAGVDAAPPRWVFEAEASSMGHAFGRAEADGWSASTGADARGIWLYGPYTRDIPAGTFIATFRLMVDNNTADDGVVVRLEVNDFDGRAPDCGDCVIASREIRRGDFAGTFAYQDFTLAFASPGAHRLELRTYWTDISYVREDRIVVTPP